MIEVSATELRRRLAMVLRNSAKRTITLVRRRGKVIAIVAPPAALEAVELWLAMSLSSEGGAARRDKHGSAASVGSSPKVSQSSASLLGRRTPW